MSRTRKSKTNDSAEQMLKRILAVAQIVIEAEAYQKQQTVKQQKTQK